MHIAVEIGAVRLVQSQEDSPYFAVADNKREVPIEEWESIVVAVYTFLNRARDARRRYKLMRKVRSHVKHEVSTKIILPIRDMRDVEVELLFT